MIVLFFIAGLTVTTWCLVRALIALPPLFRWLRERQRLTLEKEAAEWIWIADQHSNQATEFQAMSQRYQEAGLKGPAFETKCWAARHRRKHAEASGHYSATLAQLKDLT